MNNHVLVSGPPGSGKTYLATLAREQGLCAFDADLITGLHGWFHHSGAPVPFDSRAGAAFFAEHRFLWKRAELQQFLADHLDAIIFGMAANAFEVVDLFDRVFYLRVSEKTLRARLGAPDRANPMGSSAEQLEIAVQAAAHDLERAKSAGAIVIEGEAPPAHILELITRLP